ncbi:MAG: PD40 domain-containing protein [Cyclobacteriaceae bacterium]|nr:PD40 domain-containing protein [Cyclobacteriaceae bacterium]
MHPISFRKKIFFQAIVLVMLFYPLQILSQTTYTSKIQWSSQLIYQENAFQENVWSGHQVPGEPDAFPPGGLHKNAFRLRSRADIGRFVVGFSRPQPITNVIIVENFLPGRIAQVKLIDEEGYSYVIYQSVASASADNFRTLVLAFPRTLYKVREVEVSLNTLAAPGNSQIDAIGICDCDDIGDIRAELRGANFNIHRQLTFVSAREKMSEQINSKYSETKPLVSHDGKTLYFSRMFYPGNTGGREDPQDIYYSNLINGTWSKAHNIGKPFNDAHSNGVCSVSPDGNSLLVINAYMPDGSILPGVSISRKTDEGWSVPEKVEIDDFYNFSEFQDFFLSPDGKVLIMALQRKDSRGDQDLYISFKKGYNHYSRPKNMGTTLNTSSAEFSPFISQDQTTLYFASEGHSGFGQSDIFFSYRLDSTWLNWSQPRNIGPAINTSSWDAYFSITNDGRYAYFVSSEGSRRDAESIYRIALLKDIHEAPGKVEIAFKGTVYDAQTRHPIQAMISLTGKSGDNLSRLIQADELTGSFQIGLAESGMYSLEVQTPGYIRFEDEFVVDIHAGKDIRREFFLQRISPGQVINIDHIQFEQGKADLLEVSIPYVQKLIRVMLDNPGLTIELAGHTDRLGNREANIRLSEERVLHIKEHLVAAGVDAWRVQTVGYGGSRPIAPSDSEQNRAINRRVEITITNIGMSR